MTACQDEPVVTVLIPTFNRAHLLPECLESILAQTYTHFKIIVINDGSTDKTSEVIKPYLDRITYVEKENGGKSSALNTGLKYATGEFIWIMDDDDAALPDALEQHLEVFKKDPTTDFTYSGYYFEMPDLSKPKQTKIICHSAFKGSKNNLFLSFMFGTSYPEEGLILQQGMLVRRSCYDIVGPFEETLFRCQDFEMNLRLCRHFKGVRIDRPTFTLRWHSGNRGPKRERHDECERDKKWREYEAMIFQQLYETLPLCYYLDSSESTKIPSSGGSKLEALMNRMQIMANYRLCDLAAKDIHQITNLLDPDDVKAQEQTIKTILAIETKYLYHADEIPAKKIRKGLRTLLRSNKCDSTLRTQVAQHYLWRGYQNGRGSISTKTKGVAQGLGVLRIKDIVKFRKEFRK